MCGHHMVREEALHVTHEEFLQDLWISLSTFIGVLIQICPPFFFFVNKCCSLINAAYKSSWLPVPSL